MDNPFTRKNNDIYSAGLRTGAMHLKRDSGKVATKLSSEFARTDTDGPSGKNSMQNLHPQNSQERPKTNKSRGSRHASPVKNVSFNPHSSIDISQQMLIKPNSLHPIDSYQPDEARNLPNTHLQNSKSSQYRRGL